MSILETPSSILGVEEALHQAVAHEAAARAAEFDRVGLRLELDPVHRSGEASDYQSYVEAALRCADGDVHDVLFFYVARDGQLVLQPTDGTSWIELTFDEMIREAEAKP